MQKMALHSTITSLIIFILLLEYKSTEAAPAGMMAFFKQTQCPEGWEEYTNAQGRLIHSVTDPSSVNLTLNDPLPDLTTPPNHYHDITPGGINIPVKAISASLGNPVRPMAGTGIANYTVDVSNSTAQYPFVHLLLCRLSNRTAEGVPTGLIAFFEDDNCPTNWNPYTESIGRFIIPGSSENGIVYSTASPLNSSEDRTHTHDFDLTFSTVNTGFYNLVDDSFYPASPGKYYVKGTTLPATSGFPYIQLLTCRSNEGGSGADLPEGIHMFYSNGYCNSISTSSFWEDADSNITGRWIINLPENGTVGVPFGGQAWRVTSTSGRDGLPHTHDLQGQITLVAIGLIVGLGNTSFVNNTQYALEDLSASEDLQMPYLSMPMCILTDVPPTTPSGKSGHKLNKRGIGILCAFIGLLIIVAVLVALFLKKRRDRKNQQDHYEKQSGHYSTMSLSLGNMESASIIQNIQINEKLGGGNFGEVFKGTWNGTTPVALKKLKSKEQVQEFAQEAKVLLSLNHPNIVRCLGLHTSQNGDQYIVMEYLSKGSLDAVLRTEPNLKTGDLLIMSKQAAAGMLYLEQQKIVHRDLALRNLLVAHESSSYTVKVSDFGLSRKIQDEGYYMKIDTQGVPIRWTAPEVFEKGLYSTKSDVWSFGITLWELFSFGQTPYADMTNLDVMQKVVAGHRLGCPQDCPDPIYQLMLRCWQKLPEKRPGFQEIFQVIEAVSKDYSQQALRWSQITLMESDDNSNNQNYQELYNNNNSKSSKNQEFYNTPQ